MAYFRGYLGQKTVKEKVHFLEDLKTPKNHSEINWSLESLILIRGEFLNQNDLNLLHELSTQKTHCIWYQWLGLCGAG